MNLKKIKLNDLKIAIYNPRDTDRSTLDKLKNSIKEFGYLEPIVYNERTGNIIGGHNRLIVLKELYGEEHEVDAVALDLDDLHERALNLALNKIKGEWDQEKLNQILNNMDIDLVALSGFDSVRYSSKILFGEDMDTESESMKDIESLDDLDNRSKKEKENDTPASLENPKQVTFWFNDEEEKNKVSSFFDNKNENWDKNTPNLNLLKKLIKSNGSK